MNIFIKSTTVKKNKVRYERTAEKKRHQVKRINKSFKNFEIHRAKNEKYEFLFFEGFFCI